MAKYLVLLVLTLPSLSFARLENDPAVKDTVTQQTAVADQQEINECMKRRIPPWWCYEIYPNFSNSLKLPKTAEGEDLENCIDRGLPPWWCEETYSLTPDKRDGMIKALRKHSAEIGSCIQKKKKIQQCLKLGLQAVLPHTTVKLEDANETSK